MEEKKNKAIEKTEKLSEKPENKNGNEKENKVKKSVKNKNSKLREQKAEERHKRAKERQKIKAEKKKAVLLKKQERKKAKLLKKQEAEKDRKKQIQEKQNRKAELKRLKLQKKEERLRRKEYLKHESKEERRNRVLKEKQAKNELKRERLADKRAKRLEMQEERKQKRLAKRQEKKEKRTRGIGGWLAAVISLGCTVLVLSGLLTLSYFTPLDDYMMVNTAEERSFYDLVGYIDNIDVNLSKLVVSKDSEKQQKLLSDVRVETSLASSSLSTLALQDESKFYTTKFINQVGDFAKYLEAKLIDGEKLTLSDIETLRSMYEINSKLKIELSELASNVTKDFDFRSLYEGKDDNLIISKFNELESNSTEYPHMIYDGAFADNAKGKETKYLNGFNEVSKKEAEEAFKKYFSSYNLKNVTLTGETLSEKVNCYDFDGTNEDGTLLTAEISKKGGKLIEFNYYKDCSTVNYDAKSCEEIANEFLENVGYHNLKAVWFVEGNNVVSLNYASVIDGIICYSDLIKVTVCQERGVVSGIEATSYALNHTERKVGNAEISLTDAETKVSEEIEINSVRLAIIPIGEYKEKLAYEFNGVKNGETYYIYIDAKTGKELEIFKVVKTTEGTLIM